MKTVIITGGGSGIGAATAARFRDHGYQAVAVGLDKTDDLAEDIKFIKTDVTKEAEFGDVVAQFPDLKTLVNCAAIVIQEQEWTPEGFSRVVDINLNATMKCCLSSLRFLEANKGSIINIASGWSYFGAPRTPAYCASKTAIVGLTRSLAVAWAPKGVRVNAVAPGWVETRMSEVALSDAERRERILQRIPIGRFGKPSDIAKMIYFLASDDADYVTGGLFPTDGGFSIA